MHSLTNARVVHKGHQQIRSTMDHFPRPVVRSWHYVPSPSPLRTSALGYSADLTRSIVPRGGGARHSASNKFLMAPKAYRLSAIWMQSLRWNNRMYKVYNVDVHHGHNLPPTVRIWADPPSPPSLRTSLMDVCSLHVTRWILQILPDPFNIVMQYLQYF